MSVGQNIPKIHFIVIDKSFDKETAVQHIQNIVRTFAKTKNVNFIPCSKRKDNFEQYLVKELKTVRKGDSHTLIFIDRYNFDNLSGPMWIPELQASSHGMFDVTMLTGNSKSPADNSKTNKVPCSCCEKTIIKMKTNDRTQCTRNCIEELMQRMLCITGKDTDSSCQLDKNKNLEWAKNDEYLNARHIADNIAEDEKDDDWEKIFDAATEREKLAEHDAKIERKNLEDSIKEDNKRIQETTPGSAWGYRNSPDTIGPSQRRLRDFHRLQHVEDEKIRRQHVVDEKIRRQHVEDEKIRRRHFKYENIRREQVEDGNIRQQAEDDHVRRDHDRRKLETKNRIMQTNRMIDTNSTNDHMTRDNRINTRRPAKIQSKMSQENSYNHLAANLTTAVMHCMNDGNF